MDEPANPPESTSPLSLARLTAAFAKMLRPGGERAANTGGASRRVGEGDDQTATLRGVVEAMLFVGQESNAPIAVERFVEAIRDATPEEVDDAVAQLNTAYERDGAPYRIECTTGGYRFRLSAGADEVRERMRGRARAARLTPHALETLSVVAYRQPIASKEIDALRGKASGAALAQLTRRGLIHRVDPSDAATELDAPNTPQYATTERFLGLFGLTHPSQLPRVAELDD